jgi:dihydrofolate synthase/folylpolyglutamate synthase
MHGADEIRKGLFSRTGYGIKYDLERMVKASTAIGNPQNSFRSFHIAGTNGKGSTCAYLEAMLRSCGHKTGLYTSPHIIHFEERFQINGKIITENLWIDVYADLKQIIELHELTFFEAATLIAFELFKRNNVSWAVIETGLGGRLDATNIINPEISVITAIDIDHSEYLGYSIEKVALEKFGIIKENKPVVVLKNKNQEVMRSAARISDEKNARLIIVDPELHSAQESELGVSVRDFSGDTMNVAMRGRFQIANLLLASTAFRSAGFTSGSKVIDGLSKVFLPCRFQVIRIKNKTVIFDVGHNPQAASMVTVEIKKRYGKKSVCMVVGIMKDKDYQSMIQEYCSVADRIVFTQPDIPRAASTELLESCVNGSVEFRSFKSVSLACTQAINGPQEVVCITGSFHTVCEACPALGFDPFIHTFNE